MSLRIIITAGKTITVFYKNEAVEMRYSLWGNMNPGVTAPIFGALNGYLALLDKVTQEALFNCYRNSLEILDTEQDQEVVLSELNKQVRKIYQLTDYQTLRRYLMENKLVKPCLSTSETLVGNNPRETTYIRQEIFELTLFSVYIRLIAPIAGTTTRNISTVASNLFKEMETLRIITGTGFDEEEPYKRLVIYCTSYASRRKNTTSTAVKFKLAVEDLEVYILGLFVLRRLMPYELNKTDNLIRFAFKFIDGKVAKMRQGYTDKMANVSKSGQNEDSLIDHFRIAETVPGSVKSVVNIYLKDIPLLISHIRNLELDVPKVRALHAELTLKELTVHDLYIPIVALCLNKLIPRWSLNLVDREAMLSGISLAASMLRVMGHPDIATWLTASNYLKETTDISLGSSGKILRALDPELTAQLITRYPHLPQNVYSGRIATPAHFVIEEIVKMINSTEWNGDALEEFGDIRNSLARLFITPPEKFNTQK